MKKMLAVVLVLMLALGSVGALAEEGQEKGALLVGAAMRDITPSEENGVLPYPKVDGYTQQTLYITKAVDPLSVRCVAMSDGEETAVFVTYDLAGIEVFSTFSEELAALVDLPVGAFMPIATHAHATLFVSANNDVSTEAGQKDEAYFTLIKEQTFAAVQEAIANMQPAKVGIGYSDSYVNVNRNRTYFEETADGVIEYVYLGYNPGGSTENTLTAVQFDDLEGNPIAFIVNFPVHATLMHNNIAVDGVLGISADLPGVVSTGLEAKYEGAVALWTPGAAGDQNPVIMSEKSFPDGPMGGAFNITYSAGVDILQYLGSIHLADTLRALESISDMSSDIDIAYTRGTAEIPGRTFEAEYVPNDWLEKQTKYTYADGDPYTLALQVLRVGDISFVAFPGELYNSFGRTMKANSITEHTIVMNNAADLDGIRLGYLADDEALEIGGYAALTGRYQPGFAASGLVTLMNQLIADTQ